MELNLSSIIQVATFATLILGIIVLFVDRTTNWFKARDRKIIDTSNVMEDLQEVTKLAKECQLDISTMIKANQETNIQIGKLHEMVTGFNEHGSKGSNILLEKFSLKMEKFSVLLNDTDKRIIRLETLIINGKKG